MEVIFSVQVFLKERILQSVSKKFCLDYLFACYLYFKKKDMSFIHQEKKNQNAKSNSNKYSLEMESVNQLLEMKGRNK